MLRKLLISGALIPTLAASMAAGAATPQPFTFFGVQFAPREHREPLAQAFVARAMPVGSPFPAALARAKRAGARCGRPGPDGVVDCRASTMQKRPGEHLSDITWNIRLAPAADGTVAAATLTRTRSGF